MRPVARHTFSDFEAHIAPIYMHQHQHPFGCVVAIRRPDLIGVDVPMVFTGGGGKSDMVNCWASVVVENLPAKHTPKSWKWSLVFLKLRELNDDE